MKVKIVLKGWYQAKLWDGEKERIVEVPEGTTCDEALRTQGINYKEIPRFGFVALNKKRVLIDQVVHDGDEMHVYHKMNGG